MCAAMDMPYSNVTGDRSKASYSSERAAQVDMRAAVRPLQNVFRFQMCLPVHRRFMQDAILSGALPVKASAYNASPREYERAKYIAPRPEWVDPLKDVLALEKEIRLGLKSREGAIASMGDDMDQVDAAIARSNASADAYGLVLDSDPRRTNFRGSSAPPDTTAPPQPTDAAATAADDEEQETQPAGQDEAAA
jgi:capsid protein